MLIAQAWNQHVADRKKVSTTPRRLRSIMEAEWMKEMEKSQHETMVSSIEFPSPLISEVYTNSQNVMREARMELEPPCPLRQAGIS